MTISPLWEQGRRRAVDAAAGGASVGRADDPDDNRTPGPYEGVPGVGIHRAGQKRVFSIDYQPGQSKSGHGSQATTGWETSAQHIPVRVHGIGGVMSR